MLSNVCHRVRLPAVSKLRRDGFVSYAHGDARVAEHFLDLMQPRCANLRGLEIDHWTDRRILVGARWEQEIAHAIEGSDFGLLCVTPRFLASRYVTTVELPVLLRRAVVIPVVLEEPAAELSDMQGMDDLQLFRYHPPGGGRGLAFGDCAGSNAGRFCDALVAQVVKRLAPPIAAPIAAPVALAAAGRSLTRLAEHAASRMLRERIERLAALAAEAEPTARELNLGDTTVALFPGDAKPVERFRAFRQSLRRLATESDIELSCEVDGHKHAPPSARRCWFTGKDDSTRQIERLSEAATAAAESAVEVPSRARRAVRVCIDGVDGKHAEALSSTLRARLAIDRDLEVEVSDTRALAASRRRPCAPRACATPTSWYAC